MQRPADLSGTPPPVETLLHETAEERIAADLAAAGSTLARLRHALRPERPVAALGCLVAAQLPADLDGARPSRAPIARIVCPRRRRSAIVMRSSSDKNRADPGALTLITGA